MKTLISWLSRLTVRLNVLEQQGAQPVVITSATTPVVVTAAQLTKHAILTNTKADGAVVWTLPAAEAGMRLTAVVGVTQGLTLDLPTGGTIAGTATSGQTLTADALGESIQLICLVDGRWDVLAKTGTWTAA
jgi:hypothetical protein